MSVAGASQYRYASILANTQGRAAVQPNISDFIETDLLEVGRSLRPDNGIGLSKRARQLNKQFIENTRNGFNGLFSLGLAQTATVEAMQMQILALRSKTSDSGLARSLRSGAEDNGNVTEDNTRGSTVDTEA